MLETPPVGFRQLSTKELRTAVAGWLPKGGTRTEKIGAIESALRSGIGQSLREAMAAWIVDGIVPVSRLVPEAYVKWRPPVRDAMMFVLARLSAARLAPKLLEQFELPENTPAETRLLRLIAKVPGLQKLGQVIARNQNLRPALRTALGRLENGIRDVRPAEIQSIITQDLGPRLEAFAVKIAPAILSEASVSAVVRFRWRDPESGRRERGVFKVLKPHIPEYFAEDMDYLQGLAVYFGDCHHTYGFPAHLIPDTLKKVRRLLQHEVNFRREQNTLREAFNLYRNVKGVRVPRLIQPLCSHRITALTEEQGIKVTSAAARLSPARRRGIAEQLIEAVVVLPLLSAETDVIFHGDPHAGNLLYNNRTGELVLIDWALRERLSREHRRHLAVLFGMVGLRDSVGACIEILALSQHRIRSTSQRGRVISGAVKEFIDELPGDPHAGHGGRPAASRVTCNERREIPGIADHALQGLVYAGRDSARYRRAGRRQQPCPCRTIRSTLAERPPSLPFPVASQGLGYAAVQRFALYDPLMDALRTEHPRSPVAGGFSGTESRLSHLQELMSAYR